MAMKIVDKSPFSEVQLRHWDRFAEAAGLSQSLTRKRRMGMAGKLPSMARCVQAESPYRDQAMIGSIVSLMEQRCTRTLRRFKNMG